MGIFDTVEKNNRISILLFKKHSVGIVLEYFKIKTLKMHRKKALQLIKYWKSRTCLHPRIEKEYYLFKETGNKVCGVCGRIIYINAGENNQQEKF
jgi:hypothetical protein